MKPIWRYLHIKADGKTAFQVWHCVNLECGKNCKKTQGLNDEEPEEVYCDSG